MTLEKPRAVSRGVGDGKDSFTHSCGLSFGTHLLNSVVDIRKVFPRLKVPNIDIVIWVEDIKSVLRV